MWMTRGCSRSGACCWWPAGGSRRRWRIWKLQVGWRAGVGRLGAARHSTDVLYVVDHIPLPPTICNAGHIFATQLQPPSQSKKQRQHGQGQQQGGGAYVPLNAGGTAPIAPSEAAAAAVGAYRHAKRALQEWVVVEGGGAPARERLDASAVQRLQCHLLELEHAALLRLRLLAPDDAATVDGLAACASEGRALGCQAGAAAGTSVGGGQSQQVAAAALQGTASDHRDGEL